jgi:hypothetical protein
MCELGWKSLGVLELQIQKLLMPRAAVINDFGAQFVVPGFVAVDPA